MKKSLLLSGIIAAALCSTNAGAQTISSVRFNDSCYIGASTSITASIQISGPATTSCIVETTHGDGTKKDTSNVWGGGTSFSSWSNHQYATAGTYSVKHTLICSGTRVDSVTNSANAYCTHITGQLFRDVNSNCIQDPTEPYVFMTTPIEVDSAGTKVDTLYATGTWVYKFRATATTVYKFTLLSNPAGYTRSCPATNTITYTFSPGSLSIPVQYFGFNCSSTPAYDYMLGFSRALRGATSGGASYIYLYATNASCHTGAATVTLDVSPKYNITTASISPTPASISGNRIVWNFGTLANSAQVVMYIPLSPKSTTNNGDTACNYAVITPTAGDVNVANNSAGGCDSVRSSWDPNEKSVTASGPISSGKLLNYTIDFENLGNDTAFNIHIQDTLSQHLDASSFVLLGATHRVNSNIYETSNGTRVLKLDFPGINLEDKNVPTRNKGQVRFSMKLKQGLAVGTTIPNRAGIYFDGNPPVITNYATVKIPVPQSVPGAHAQTDVQIFPNPAHETLSIELTSTGWNEAQLYNSIGQTVRRSSLNTGLNTLSIGDLPNGIYHLLIRGANGMMSQKIEKY